MSEVKRKLERVTGIPAAEMKVRLGGYNQMVMLDTTTNVRVGTCGVTRGALSARAAMVSWLICLQPQHCRRETWACRRRRA